MLVNFCQSGLCVTVDESIYAIVKKYNEKFHLSQI